MRSNAEWLAAVEGDAATQAPPETKMRSNAEWLAAVEGEDARKRAELEPTPIAKPEPSATDALMGATKMLAGAMGGIGTNPVMGMWNAYRTFSEGLSPGEQESVKEYGPKAAILGASTMVPGGVVAQGLVNVAGNSASDAWSAYRRGEDVAAAANPLNKPGQTAIAMAAPAVVKGVVGLGKSIYRGLTAPSISETLGGAPMGPDLRVSSRLLPLKEAGNETIEAAPGSYRWSSDLDRAMAIDAPMRPLPAIGDEVPDQLLLEGPEDFARRLQTAAPEERVGMLQRWREIQQGLRSDYSAPARFLRRSKSPAAQNAGVRAEELTLGAERLTNRSDQFLSETFQGLSPEARVEVTKILDGSLPATEASSPEVLTAAGRMREFYSRWANLAEREGLLRKNKLRGGYEPFQRVPENYSPRILKSDLPQAWSARLRGLYKKQTSAYSRVPAEVDNPDDYLTDALEIGKAYADKYSKLVSTARTFGSATTDPMMGTPWGGQAQKIYEALQTPETAVEAEMFKGLMDRLYTGQASPGDSALAAANAQFTKGLLGGSWMTQLGQAATPVWRYGLGNTIEGMLRYKRDPALRALIDASGVRDPGFAHLAFGDAPVASLPIKAISGIERFLRGPLNAGAVPYIEDLSAQAAAGPVSKAVAKQLDELLMTPESAARPLTALSLQDAIQASGRRAQFHAGIIGQTGNKFLDQPVRSIVSLQPYGWKAWQAAQDDVLEPLLSRDASLRQLGASRLAKLIGAGLAAETLREAVQSPVRNREMSRDEIVANLLGTQFGTVGQLAGSKLVNPNSDSRFLASMPMASMALGIYDEATRGQFGRAALDLGAVVDPTGVVAMTRPTIKGYLLTQDREPERRQSRRGRD